MIQLPAHERVRVAKELDMNEQYLYQCLTKRRAMPPERCPGVERATEALVSVEELRPDINWLRVPDADWPHPGGRPCIDVAAPAAVGATND